MRQCRIGAPGFSLAAIPPSRIQLIKPLLVDRPPALLGFDRREARPSPALLFRAPSRRLRLSLRRHAGRLVLHIRQCRIDAFGLRLSAIPPSRIQNIQPRAVDFSPALLGFDPRYPFLPVPLLIRQTALRRRSGFRTYARQLRIGIRQRRIENRRFQLVAISPPRIQLRQPANQEILPRRRFRDLLGASQSCLYPLLRPPTPLIVQPSVQSFPFLPQLLNLLRVDLYLAKPPRDASGLRLRLLPQILRSRRPRPACHDRRRGLPEMPLRQPAELPGSLVVALSQCRGQLRPQRPMVDPFLLLDLRLPQIPIDQLRRAFPPLPQQVLGIPASVLSRREAVRLHLTQRRQPVYMGVVPVQVVERHIDHHSAANQMALHELPAEPSVRGRIQFARQRQDSTPGQLSIAPALGHLRAVPQRLSRPRPRLRPGRHQYLGAVDARPSLIVVRLTRALVEEPHAGPIRGRRDHRVALATRYEGDVQMVDGHASRLFHAPHREAMYRCALRPPGGRPKRLNQSTSLASLREGYFVA